MLRPISGIMAEEQTVQVNGTLRHVKSVIQSPVAGDAMKDVSELFHILLEVVLNRLNISSHQNNVWVT